MSDTGKLIALVGTVSLQLRRMNARQGSTSHSNMPSSSVRRSIETSAGRAASHESRKARQPIYKVSGTDTGLA
jgi:hypothetical protein